MEVEPFTKGSIVEVSSDDVGFHGSWYVATLLDIVDASTTKKTRSNSVKKGVGYLVRYATLSKDDMSGLLTEIVHPSYVRPSPPRNPRRVNDNLAVVEAETEEDGDGVVDFQLYDVVDTYLRDGWWIGVVRKVIDGEGGMRKYLISFESPTEEVEFEGSQMRLHVDWINSCWKLRPQKTPEEESADKKVTETSDSNNKSNNGVPSDIITSPKKASVTDSAKKRSRSRKKAETSETQDGNSQLKRKRGKLSKLPFQRPDGSFEDNQERDSSDFLKSSCYTTVVNHDEATDATMVNESQTTTENHHVWPFVKQSPIWATIESQELYKNFPQNPHFSPLTETKEDLREGLAIAHMVTFANIVQRITNLQFTDSNHLINITLETLLDLEANGFDVGPIRGRLDELLAKKSQVGRFEGEMKETEKGLEKCSREKRAIDEEINGLQRKMWEMEEKMVKVVALKNVNREKVMVFSRRIADRKLAFEQLVGRPL